MEDHEKTTAKDFAGAYFLDPFTKYFLVQISTRPAKTATINGSVQMDSKPSVTTNGRLRLVIRSAWVLVHHLLVIFLAK